GGFSAHMAERSPQDFAIQAGSRSFAGRLLRVLNSFGTGGHAPIPHSGSLGGTPPMISSATSPARPRRTSIWAMSIIALFAIFSLVGSGSAVAAVPEGTSSATVVPWIQSDQADYAPGATVTLTGGNWAPGD